jgi:hypothetical protein
MPPHLALSAIVLSAEKRDSHDAADWLPYHYLGCDPTTFADALKGTRIEVRLRDWYAAGQ